MHRIALVLALAGIVTFSPPASGQTADPQTDAPADAGVSSLDQPGSLQPISEAEVVDFGGCGPACGPAGCIRCRDLFGHGYARFDYLFWWRRGAKTPPLVTSSPPGTAQGDAGVLGLSTTNILFGGTNTNDDGRPGGRVSIGRWFDPCEVNGLEVRFWALGSDDVNFNVDSNDTSIIARPFFNTSTDQQDARLVNFAGFTEDGLVDITTTSQVIGGDVIGRMGFSRGVCFRWDVIGGYQAARLEENLTINDRFRSVAGGTVPVNTIITSQDIFDVRNEFHGGVIGVMGEYQGERINWSFLAKLGLGRMRERVTISGFSTTTPPGLATTVTNGGLLAQPSNIGTFTQNQFAVVPEIGISANWCLSERVTLSAGYSFIYWSRLVRAGNQVDLNVNPTQVPGPPVGPATPQFSFNPTSFWVMGFNVGVEGRW